MLHQCSYFHVYLVAADGRGMDFAGNASRSSIARRPVVTPHMLLVLVAG